MNSGSSWWSELVIFLATVELFLLVLVWRIIRKVKKVNKDKGIHPDCTILECPVQQKVQTLQEEVIRLKDAVLIATPVMQDNAPSATLMQFKSCACRRKDD